MKSNNMFPDQVNSVTSWFENCNECEKTVALYRLLKRISATQCKFLAQVLEQTDCSDVCDVEEEANNPNFISKLCSESKETAINQLLKHLPLLRVGNRKAKTEYLGLIPLVLSYFIENRTYIEECRQLLSYSFIHPALTSDERAHFNWWISHLEERFTSSYICQQSKPKEESFGFTVTVEKPSNSYTEHKPVGSGRLNGSFTQYRDPVNHESMLESTLSGNRSNSNILSDNLPMQSVPSDQCQNDLLNSYPNHHMPIHATLSAPANISAIVSSSHSQDPNTNPHNKLRRTPSVIPSSLATSINHVNDWLRGNEDPSMGQGRPHALPFDHSPGHHPPLSPQSSITSSGSSSDTHQDDGPNSVRNSFLEEGSGMRDVPMWLKSLRLHKYAYLFQQMTYEEMMNITEKWLEDQGVTKGARHKIVLSIGKLKERQGLLRSLEKDIVEGGSVKTALSEMKSMLNTPIKCYDADTEGRIPSSPPPSPVSENDNSIIAEGDVPAQFTRLMGKVFTQLLVASRPDDECFNLFLQMIDKCINHEAFSHRQRKKLASWKQEAQRNWQPKYNVDRKPKSGWGNTFPLGTSGKGGVGVQRPMRLQKSGPQWSFGTKRSIVGGTTSGHAPLQRNSSLNPAIFSRPGLLEHTQKPPVTRTHSAPLRSPHLGLNITGCDQSSNDNAENYAQLDSLCLSVTEHALGSLEVNDKGSTY